MTTETIPLTQDQGGARPDGPGASRCATGADTVSAHAGDAPSRKIASAAIYAWARQVLADQYEADDMAGVAAVLRAGGDGHLPTQTALHAMVKFAAMYPRGDRSIGIPRDENADAIKRARDLAMRMTAEARIPECGHFAAIAQDLDAVCAERGHDRHQLDRRIVDGLKAFCECEPDFDMSPNMRRRAAEFILGQPVEQGK